MVRPHLDVTRPRMVATFVAWLHPPFTPSPSQCRTLRDLAAAKGQCNIVSTSGARHCSTSTDRPQRTIGESISVNAVITTLCPHVRFNEYERSLSAHTHSVIDHTRPVTGPACYHRPAIKRPQTGAEPGEHAHSANWSGDGRSRRASKPFKTREIRDVRSPRPRRKRIAFGRPYRATGRRSRASAQGSHRRGRPRSHATHWSHQRLRTQESHTIRSETVQARRSAIRSRRT
jgi:hypothetical protein